MNRVKLKDRLRQFEKECIMEAIFKEAIQCKRDHEERVALMEKIMGPQPKPMTMPILERHQDGEGFPNSVTIPLDRNDQALANHNQTLARLKERGGLAPSEAVALMNRHEPKSFKHKELIQMFIEFGWLEPNSASAEADDHSNHGLM